MKTIEWRTNCFRFTHRHNMLINECNHHLNIAILLVGIHLLLKNFFFFWKQRHRLEYICLEWCFACKGKRGNRFQTDECIKCMKWIEMKDDADEANSLGKHTRNDSSSPFEQSRFPSHLRWLGIHKLLSHVNSSTVQPSVTNCCCFNDFIDKTRKRKAIWIHVFFWNGI